MDNEIYRLIADAFSSPRLQRYLGNAPSPREAVARYFWNIQISSAFLPLLAIYEVALRNAAHRALSAKFGNEEWFDRVLRGQEFIEFNRRRQVIEDRHRSPVTVDKLVSELMLGFWTHLFARKYRKVWWDAADAPDFALKSVLIGNLATDGSTRSHLMRRASYFLVLRNRVGHHESILEGIQPYGQEILDLEEVHQLLIETIGWLNPNLERVALGLDRFVILSAPASLEALRADVELWLGSR